MKKLIAISASFILLSQIIIFVILLYDNHSNNIPLETRRPKSVLERVHFDTVYCIKYSPDGKKLATGSWDKSAIIWDIDGNQNPTVLAGHTDWVSTVAFSPDGRMLATGSHDSVVKIWELLDG